MSIKLATLGVLGNTRPVRGDAHEAVSCLHVRLELRAQWGDLLVALGPAPTMTREDGRVSRAGVAGPRGRRRSLLLPPGSCGGEPAGVSTVGNTKGRGGRQDELVRADPSDLLPPPFSPAPCSPARRPRHVKRKTNGVCVQSHRDTSF